MVVVNYCCELCKQIMQTHSLHKQILHSLNAAQWISLTFIETRMILIITYLQLTLHEFVFIFWFYNYSLIIYLLLLGLVIAKVFMIVLNPQWLKGQQGNQNDWKENFYLYIKESLRYNDCYKEYNTNKIDFVCCSSFIH